MHVQVHILWERMHQVREYFTIVLSRKFSFSSLYNYFSDLKNCIYFQGLKSRRDADYLCNHNILKAHARAYHIYDKEFRAQQQGKIGIVLCNFFYFSKQKDDHVSNEVGFQYQFGMYAHPIFSKEGDYPAIIKNRIDENSAFEGLPRSRLPTFSNDWINYIK